MFTRWLSWFVFVVHTVLLTVVLMGGYVPSHPSQQTSDIPATEQTITQDGVPLRNTRSFYLDESDQLEERSEYKRSDKLPERSSRPKLTTSVSTLASCHLESSRGRGPPRARAPRALSPKDRWLAVSLPTRGPPTLSSPAQG